MVIAMKIAITTRPKNCSQSNLHDNFQRQQVNILKVRKTVIQMNVYVRALIGQSAMAYGWCQKTHGKFAHLMNYQVKAISTPQVSMVQRHDKLLGMLKELSKSPVNHSPAARDIACG